MRAIKREAPSGYSMLDLGLVYLSNDLGTNVIQARPSEWRVLLRKLYYSASYIPPRIVPTTRCSISSGHIANLCRSELVGPLAVVI